MKQSVFDILKERGYLAQVTDEDTVRDLLAKPGVSFYIGFDPTADSLHVGHFSQMMLMDGPATGPSCSSAAAPRWSGILRDARTCARC
jgi:hypothetical protein